MKKFGKILVAVLMLATLVGACFAFTACNNDGKVKIGAQQGTTGLFYLQGNADMNFSGYSNIEAKSYDSIGQAVQDMKTVTSIMLSATWLLQKRLQTKSAA